MIICFLAPVLLADVREVLGLIITFGAIIIWVIQKIAEANKAMQKRPPRAAALPPAGAAQGGAKPGGQQADPLRSQVEEFLRRANQANQPRQATPRARKPAVQESEIELLVDENAYGTPQDAIARSPRLGSKLPSAMPGDKKPTRPQRKTVAQRADERAAARTSAIAQKVSSLGKRIIADDQQFDDKLKAKFDHAVGRLASNSMTEIELVPVRQETPASQIAAMLANPDGVRQAIVLNEVLRRPTDRW
jgi:hypothetical protein